MEIYCSDIILLGMVLLCTNTTADISPKKIIDLTWDVDEQSINWPGTQPFRYTKVLQSMERGYWYACKDFATSEHGGTHIDAPFHFVETGWKVADIPLERLLVNGILLDFIEETNKNGPDYNIDSELLEEKLKTFEPIPNNTVVIIKTGWSKYWTDRKKYLGQDENGNFHFPGLNGTSAKVIVAHKSIVGVAIDTSSIDAGNTKTFEAHRILLGNNVYDLENTKLIDKLPEKNFRLIIAPMKLKEGTGAPTRIFALLDEKIISRNAN